MAKPAFVPNHYFLANLVYAANGDCIDTVICDGKIIMEDQHIPGQETIYRKVQEVADKVVDYKKRKKKVEDGSLPRIGRLPAGKNSQPPASGHHPGQRPG